MRLFYIFAFLSLSLPSAFAMPPDGMSNEERLRDLQAHNSCRQHLIDEKAGLVNELPGLQKAVADGQQRIDQANVAAAALGKTNVQLAITIQFAKAEVLSVKNPESSVHLFPGGPTFGDLDDNAEAKSDLEKRISLAKDLDESMSRWNERLNQNNNDQRAMATQLQNLQADEARAKANLGGVSHSIDYDQQRIDHGC